MPGKWCFTHRVEMSKYHNRKTEVDGFVFDSKREADRYQELKLLEKNGDIHDLVLQPKYKLFIEDSHICYYYADFSYTDNFSGNAVVEDVKGVRTAVYRLKKKLFEAIYHIDITEV